MRNNFHEQLNKLIPLIDKLSILTNDIGISFTGKMGSELGLKGFVYLDLMQRINANLEALLLLLKKFDTSQELKAPIALLLRACLSDVLTGYYLYTFLDDDKTFENEVNVLGLDYANYMIAMVENEPIFTAKDLTKEESQRLISQMKQIIADTYQDLIKEFDEKSGKLYKFKPEEVRNSSNQEFFNRKEYIKSQISDKSKYEQILRDNKLHDVAYVYVLMRFFAQFQHYAMYNREIMLLDPFKNFWFIVQSFFYINGAIYAFGIIINAKNDLLEPVENLLDEYKGFCGLIENSEQNNN